MPLHTPLCDLEVAGAQGSGRLQYPGNSQGENSPVAHPKTKTAPCLHRTQIHLCEAFAVK